MSTEIPRSNRRFDRLPLLVAILGLAVYLAGLGLAARADGERLLQVSCFDARHERHLSPGRVAIASAMAVGAVLLLCVAPWMLGAQAVRLRFPRLGPSAAVWSLAGNTAALLVVCFVLRETFGIGRGTFLAGWVAWTTILAVAAGFRTVAARPACLVRRPEAIAAWIGVGTVVACLVFLHREVFLQCFNGDGTELHELARSLRTHPLPYWEIEPAGVFGTAVVNPLVANSYWTFGFQLLLGDTEFASRLPYWVWWLGIFCVSLQILRGTPQQENCEVRGQVHFSDGDCRIPGSTSPENMDLTPSHWTSRFSCPPRAAQAGGASDDRQDDPLRAARAFPPALLLVLGSFWYALYVGYDPYLGDLANPGVSDAMFTLWLLLGFECLRRGDTAGWVASSVAASLVFYAGPVIFVLTLAAALYWQPVPRQAMLRAGLIGGGILLALLALYLGRGAWEGTLPAWWASFDEEWLSKYLHASSPARRGLDALLFLGYFVLGCGGVAALGMVHRLGRGTPWQRTAGTVILAYLAIILGSGSKNLHYLGPLLPITLLVWLTDGPADGRHHSAGQVERLRKRRDWFATLGLAAAIALCWPAAQPTFTLNRELGARTQFLTNSYEEACRWARIRTPLYERGALGWEIGQHTWVGYATLSARFDAKHPLCVTDGSAPAPDYALVLASPDGTKLYCRDPDLLRQLAGQRPLDGPDRFPRVLRPIAPKGANRVFVVQPSGGTSGCRGVIRR